MHNPAAGYQWQCAPITVAVCTHNRPIQLQRALSSLLDQLPSAGEILVVDNAPSDDSVLVLVTNGFPGVRYVREPVPGLDAARNRALLEARFPIVAFLDDDAVAHRAWAATIATAFASNSRLGACTGRTEALKLESAAQCLFESNGGFGRGERRICLPGDSALPLHGKHAPLIAWAVSIGSGCSLAVRREAALEIGGFDEALDQGAALPGGGDHDILWRLLDAGYELAYEPDALAWHEHRREWGAVVDQIVGHQRALIALLTKVTANSRGRRRVGAVSFLVWRLLKPGVRLYRRLRGRDPLPASVLLRMWVNCWCGLYAYPLARRLARKRRSEAAASPETGNYGFLTVRT